MTDPVTGFDIPDTGFYEWGGYILRNWLMVKVPVGVTVSTEIPNPRPARLIVVRGATTSWRDNIAVSKRRAIIHTYDTKESLAVRMAEMVRGYLIDGMYSRGSGFRGLTVIGEPFYFPDPDDPAKTPRAQMTVDFLIRAKHAPYGVTPGS